MTLEEHVAAGMHDAQVYEKSMWMPKDTYIKLAQTPLDTSQNTSFPSEGQS